MIPQNSFHVKFFDSRKQLYQSVLDLLEKGDHIFLSGDKNKNTPLWHTYIQGTILNINKQKEIIKLDLIEEDHFKDLDKRIEIETTKTVTKKSKIIFSTWF